MYLSMGSKMKSGIYELRTKIWKCALPVEVGGS